MAEKLTEEQELEVLFPQPVEVKAGSITIEVMPMDTITCARFAKKAAPILRSAMDGLTAVAASNRARGKTATETDAVEAMVGALLLAATDYPEELVEAIAVATGRTVEFVGRLPPSISLALATVIFKVNADFFSQSAERLGLGALAILVPKAAAAVPTSGAGQTH